VGTDVAPDPVYSGQKGKVDEVDDGPRRIDGRGATRTWKGQERSVRGGQKGRALVFSGARKKGPRKKGLSRARSCSSGVPRGSKNANNSIMRHERVCGRGRVAKRKEPLFQF